MSGRTFSIVSGILTNAMAKAVNVNRLHFVYTVSEATFVNESAKSESPRDRAVIRKSTFGGKNPCLTSVARLFSAPPFSRAFIKYNTFFISDKL